jgi:hypothetical protein
MLRLILLVLFLTATYAASVETDGGGGWNPLGLNASPSQTETDGGSGWDPLG